VSPEARRPKVLRTTLPGNGSGPGRRTARGRGRPAGVGPSPFEWRGRGSAGESITPPALTKDRSAQPDGEAGAGSDDCGRGVSLTAAPPGSRFRGGCPRHWDIPLLPRSALTAGIRMIAQGRGGHSPRPLPAVLRESQEGGSIFPRDSPRPQRGAAPVALQPGRGSYCLQPSRARSAEVKPTAGAGRLNRPIAALYSSRWSSARISALRRVR